mmetsp:Transcript_108207/g.312734  ORF Transcript_108207/g.312734 Transcript_108207/m.312734 type:complete len:369 (+) Transcript_108207:75-1181(+)
MVDHGMYAGAEGVAAPPPPPMPTEQDAYFAEQPPAAGTGAEFREHVAVAPPSRPGSTVLIPLCRKGDRAGIERHILAGTGSVEELDIEGNTPLHVAIEAPKNEIATVQCLLQFGANINAVNYIGAAPLHYVCLRKSNYRGIANILLENGANIDCQTLAGKTPLHFAAEQQVTELVEVLCLFGSDPNIPDTEGNSAMHLALAKPGRDTVKLQILEVLMGAGAGFQAPNLQGYMPVHLACRNGCMRCLQLLVERQADIGALSSRGETGLHLAVMGNHGEVTQQLLTLAPKLMDSTDVDGNSPLHLCALHGSLDCAVLLLRMGVETNGRNAAGKTPFDLAKTRGNDLSSSHNPELEHLLKDAQKSGGCRQS